MAQRAVLQGSTHSLGGSDYWQYRNQESGIDPGKALGMAGLGLYGWSRTKPWEGGGSSAKSFQKAASTFDSAAKGYQGLGLASSLMDITRPRNDIGDPSVYKDEKTGKPMTRSGVMEARELAAKASGKDYISPGGEAFRNVVDPGNMVKTLTDWALMTTPAGLGVMANQLTASEEKPAGRIPILSSIQKARDMVSEKISKSAVGKGITKGLGTVYDKTIGKVMETAPARAIHKGVETGYGMIDTAVGGLLPGGQKAGEGYVAKGYGKLDKLMGGYLPGGQSPAKVKEMRAEEAADEKERLKARDDWAYSKARGLPADKQLQAAYDFTLKDYSEYMEYIGPRGLEVIARQRAKEGMQEEWAYDEDLKLARKKNQIEVDKLNKWYDGRVAQGWNETAALRSAGMDTSLAQEEPPHSKLQDALWAGPNNYQGGEQGYVSDYTTIESSIGRKLDAAQDMAVEKAAAKMGRYGIDMGAPGSQMFAGLPGVFDDYQEKVDMAKEKAMDRALDRARSRMR